MRMTTAEMRELDADACAAIDARIVDVLGADGSIYRAAHDGSQWIVVTSRGGTTYKVGGFTELSAAFERIRGIADDREAR